MEDIQHTHSITC